MKRTGFSIIELLVAVAVVSILVAVAIPQFKMFIVRAKRAEAISLLSFIYRAETAHYGGFSVYYPPATCPDPQICFYWPTSFPYTTSEINQKLGLGPGTVFHGWKVSRDYLAGGTDRDTAYVIRKPPNHSFQAYVSQDLDNKVMPVEPDNKDQDWWMIQSCPSIVWPASKCGVPVLHLDDITGLFE